MSDENEHDEVDDPDFDGVSEDEVNGRIFDPGSEILILHQDGGQSVGAYVGLTDFGVIYRATYRMKMVQEEIDASTGNMIRESLMGSTITELKAIAEEEEISLKGLKKKIEIVSEITDCMIAQINAQMEPHEELVLLKRTVMTFLPWSEVARIERADEYLEEKELERFSQSLDQFRGISEDEALVGPGEGEGKNE